MKDLLEQIKCLRVLVIGDVMLDRYVIGNVIISRGTSSVLSLRMNVRLQEVLQMSP